ncbi:hypothetical protein C1H46_015674 [Malus baccata]|uniref:Phytocyanin domain-containing protein n=1 Tax=Malus baccata TaxID=106549 RepID=A0A540MJ11_MALBA|nr:hypothetical protein C1H46_015674 [Malus baccata]
MAGAVTLKVAVAVLAVGIAAVSLGGSLVGAQVHHVVGGDRGWDPSSDLASWSSGKTFRAGDKMCESSLSSCLSSLIRVCLVLLIGNR